jgi:hypothetical protein
MDRLKRAWRAFWAAPTVPQRRSEPVFYAAPPKIEPEDLPKLRAWARSPEARIAYRHLASLRPEVPVSTTGPGEPAESVRHNTVVRAARLGGWEECFAQLPNLAFAHVEHSEPTEQFTHDPLTLPEDLT